MTMTLAMITFDSTDPGPLAQWWAQRTGGTIEQENDGWFYVVSVPSAPYLAFQKVPDPTPGKNRIHLDLSSPDLDAEVAELLDAGATEVARRQMGDFRWVTLADPQGNQFCVSGPHPM